MKTIFRAFLIAVTVSGLSVFGSAQVAQNQTGVSDSKAAEKQSAKASDLSDREKELLARIERLEKRLTELEQRSENAAVVPPNGAAAKTIVSSTGTQPAPNSASVSKTNSDTSESVPSKEVSKQDKPKFLEEGVVPKSIRIPGTDLSFRLGGYVKADFIQDFDGIGNRSQFATNTIPIRGTPNADLEGGTNLQARETRIILELFGDKEKVKKNLHLYVEGDFFGDNNAFRLRHAYAEYGRMLAGQTWTTFMDISARPRTLDYEGSDGEIFVRQTMFRWTQPISKNWKFAAAVEEPTVQIAAPTGFSGSARGNVPDFTGFVRYERKRGHFQIAGVVRNLRFDGTGNTENESTTGWGLNSTFKINPFGKDQVMGQFAFGSGISRYIPSMSGQNVDALFGAGNELSALPARTGMFAYERHWTPKLLSVFNYSIADISYNTGFGGSVIKRTQDVHVNLIWTPYKLVDLGVEYIWGRRDNQNGTRGDATRLMFSTVYRIN